MEMCSDILSSAMRYERTGKWRKAVLKYEKLISQMTVDKLGTKHRLNEQALRKLLYECHLHCGDAYQHLQQTAKAIYRYTDAIQIISTKKINCCIGCISGKVLHLHVPALARIALCKIQQGEYQMASNRTQEALRLDSQNPDLFCIKACTSYLLKDKAMIIKNINDAIWLNPKHVCAWLLRGVFKEIQKQNRCTTNKDFEMAHSLDYTTMSYFSTELNPSTINRILSRYLPSLRVSHTVYPVDVTCQEDVCSKRSSTTIINDRISSSSQGNTVRHCMSRKKKPVFLCGMSSSYHSQKSQTLLKEHERLLTTDVLRTRSMPDIRTATSTYTHNTYLQQLGQHLPSTIDDNMGQTTIQRRGLSSGKDRGCQLSKSSSASSNRTLRVGDILNCALSLPKRQKYESTVIAQTIKNGTSQHLYQS